MTESVGAASGLASVTVADALRSSPVGAYMDRSATDVLGTLNLPQLPQLPAITLPDLSGLQLPTLPTIDLTTLVTPLTELLSSFGSGVSKLGESFDPTAIFSALSSALTSVLSSTQSAISQVSTSWTGEAAEGAKIKSAAVQKDIPTVANQGQQLNIILLDAERIVAQGYALLTALISRTIASIVAAGAFILTPAGLPALIAIATDAMSEGLAIVAQTRLELTGKTLEVVAAGVKIPITGAPTIADAAVLANQVVSAMQPYTNIASTVAQKVVEKGSSVVTAGSTVAKEVATQGQSVISALTNTTDTSKKTTDTTTDKKTTDEKTTDEKKTTEGAGDGGGGGGGGGLGIGGVPTTTSPLSNLTSRVPTGESNPLSGSPSGRANQNGNQTVRATTTSPAMSGMGGMGAGAGRAGDAGESGAGADRSNLVTGAHGDEVVGLIEGVSIPVVGAVEVVEESPDKALTL